MKHTMEKTMEECIGNCQRCAQVCAETLDYLHAEPVKGISERITLLEDCIQICKTSASFMERGSKEHKITCGACAEICQKCADACAEITHDAQMQQCAEACRMCAASCREMSS